MSKNIRISTALKQRSNLIAESKKLWDRYVKLYAEGNMLLSRGESLLSDKKNVEGYKLCAEADLKYAEGHKVSAEADRMCAEANYIIFSAIFKDFGDAQVKFEKDCVIINNVKYS